LAQVQALVPAAVMVQMDLAQVQVVELVPGRAQVRHKQPQYQ
jgi:hypothetical protein